jgi:hypothetical protein
MPMAVILPRFLCRIECEGNTHSISIQFSSVRDMHDLFLEKGVNP